MPVVLTFDVPVKNRKEFEKHLSVTTAPKQEGSWSWFSDKEVHFRPKSYWKPGTKVTATADLNGLDAGNGIYGQNTTSTSFTVGRSLITKINLDTKKAKVYIDGDLERTIPISAGKSGWTTRSGTKLIMEKLPVTRMTNEMIGADEAYDLRVKYALRITWSGEFLHAAPVELGQLRSGQRQPRLRRDEHRRRRLAVQPGAGRRPRGHHRIEPRPGEGQRLHRLGRLLVAVPEGLGAVSCLAPLGRSTDRMR